MKKIMIGIIIMCLISVSIFISNPVTGADEAKSYSGNGISFQYPQSWEIAESDYNDTLVAIADPNSVNSVTGYAETSMIVEKRDLNTSFDRFYNESYSKLFSDSSYQLISEGNSTVSGNNSKECLYKFDSDGSLKQAKAIWMEHDGSVYVILFTSKQSNFEAQKKYTDFVLSSFTFN
jgi:hypothetical protein